jgi:decaprenyl-phosphate phosphoribosyltransferase
MAQLLYYILKSARPRQWIKNLAVFAALIFSGLLFHPGYFEKVFLAYLLFCGLSSAVYIVNDVADVVQDRKHPFKRKRPIAAGDLPVPIALFVSITLMFVVFASAWAMSFYLFLLLLAYLLVNFLYTFQLKNVPILDVFTIAAGFVLRVYVGAAVVNIHMNVWFLLTVLSVSLFLAVGKRQSERTLLKGSDGTLIGHRVTLTAYTPRLLDIYTGMFANATWFTYALFAFQWQFEADDGPLPTIFSLLPRTFISQKWLMLTVPIVIFGVMRYLQLVYEKNQGESPERVLLSDRPLLIAVALWGGLTMLILYGIGY